jgi:hypothetical protein
MLCLYPTNYGSLHEDAWGSWDVCPPSMTTPTSFLVVASSQRSICLGHTTRFPSTPTIYTHRRPPSPPTLAYSSSPSCPSACATPPRRFSASWTKLFGDSTSVSPIWTIFWIGSIPFLLSSESYVTGIPADGLFCLATCCTSVSSSAAFRSWRWRWYAPPKRGFTYESHGTIS